MGGGTTGSIEPTQEDVEQEAAQEDKASKKAPEEDVEK